MDVQPVVKNIEVVNMDYKYHMDVALKFFQEEKYNESADLFKTTI